MAYAWIAFYEGGKFLKEVHGARPPQALHDPGDDRQRPLLSIQFYDHAGFAFIEQVFEPAQRPILARVSVASPARAGTVLCHVLGWQETARDAQGNLLNVQHLAHAIEDGRIIMTPGPADPKVFARPHRRVHPDARPYTWAAVYDDLDRPPALYQFDPETGVEVSGEHIDRARLRALILLDRNGDPRIEQIFERGQRVIYRRRVAQPVNSYEPITVFLLGWQRDARDEQGRPRNVQHVSYTFEATGNTIMAGRFDDNHQIFHGLVPVRADRAMVGVGGYHRAEGVGRG